MTVQDTFFGSCGVPTSTLQALCIRALPTQTWFELDPHLQYILYPPAYHRALSRLQHVWFEKFRVQMEEQASLLEKLQRRAFRKQYLRHPSARTFERNEDNIWGLEAGEHMAVFDGMVFHHGIFLGKNPETHRLEVMDNSNDVSNVTGKSIQIRTLGEFLGNRREFDILECKCPEGQDETEFRREIVNMAYELYGLQYNTLVHNYNAVTWNCECFVWYCVTQGTKSNSEQVKRICEAVDQDMKSRHSLLQGGAQAVGQAVSHSSGFSGCCIQ